MRTTGEIHLRSRAAAQIATLIMAVCFLLAGVWLVKGIDGFVVTSALDTLAESTRCVKKWRIRPVPG